MGLFDVIGAAIAGQPDMPAFQPVDPQAEQTKAVQGNLAQAPALQNLAGSFTTFNEAQIEKMLQTSIPGYTSLKSGISDNIESMLKGEIPSDVQASIERSTAAKALAGGYGGTGAAKSLTARDLGLTSLDLTSKGISSAQSWIAQMNNTYGSGLVSPTAFSNMFLTPGQQISHQTEERNAQFQHDFRQNIMDWQSSPAYLGGAAVSSLGDAAQTYFGGGGAGAGTGGAVGAAVGGGL